MVGSEIKMCGTIHLDGYIIQADCIRHSVRCLQYTVKVVCIPIISNETIRSDPNVGLECVTLVYWSISIG